ncbi:hypothetical protein GH733_014175 [Mirounga leonina]|nr:hypothetical protein GH733_014175 [Mirounga leonina]
MSFEESVSFLCPTAAQTICALDSVSQLIEADMNFQKSLTEQGVELKSCAKFHVYTKFPHTYVLHYEVQNQRQGGWLASVGKVKGERFLLG